MSTTTTIPVSIAPWLSVSHGEKAVDFYKRAFAAIETYRLEVPGGGLVVQLAVQGAAFWISSEPVPDNKVLPENLGGDSVRMILTVSNPDVFFTQALEAGATEIFPVGDAHGWRLGRLEDPFGLHWEIGHQLVAK